MFLKAVKNRYSITAIITVILSLVSCYTIVFTNIRLGIKGEWAWQRITNVNIDYQNIIFCIVFFIIVIFIAIKVDRKIKKKSYKIICILIISIISLYIDYRITNNGKIGNVESLNGIINKWTTENIVIAGDIKSPKSFFTFLDFITLHSKKKINYEYTHPPGYILLSHLAYKTVVNYPEIKDILQLFTSKDKILHAYNETINQNYFSYVKDFENTFFAALLIYFIMLLALLCAKLLIIISILLLCKSFSNIGLISILLICVPAPILFLGHYDTLQYFLSSLAMLFFIISIIKNSDLGSFLAGIIVGTGIFCSGTFGLIVILISIVYFLNIFKNRYNIFKLLFFLFGVSCVIAICRFYSFDIIPICFKSIENDTKLFSETVRSFAWIIPDIIDYIIAVGILPFILLIINAFRKRDKTETNLITTTRYIFICILLIIILNPYNRAEIARLLIFLLPVNIILIGKDIVNTLKENHSYYLTILSSFSIFVLILVIKLHLKLIVLL